MVRFIKISAYFSLFIFLNSCAIVEFPFNQIGFKIKNPIYNDNNAANYKYNKQTFMGVKDRRMPSENEKYIAMSVDSPSSDSYNSNPTMSSFESNYGAKKNNFWKKVYSSNISEQDSYSNTNTAQANEIKSTSNEKSNEYQLNNTNKESLDSKPTTTTEINYNENDEKILKSIEFIDNDKSHTK